MQGEPWGATSFISPVQAVFFTSDPVWTAHPSSLVRTGEPLKSHNISTEARGGDTGLYPKDTYHQDLGATWPDTRREVR